MGAGSGEPGGGKLARFELIEVIGRGAAAVVYKAHDPLMQRTIALKVIEPALVGPGAGPADSEERFLSEARLAGRLAHPGIVVVHDVGKDPESGRLFIALEHLEGRTLDELTAGGAPVAWREALRITARVAEALHHAHERGVVHRHVKPANVMLLGSGEPKVMDFGIAKLATGTYGTTGTSRLLGTPLYLSPEQVQAEEGDRRTDVFSLGAVAYRLLTARHAFDAESLPKILERVVREDPPPPSQVVTGIPADVDRVVARALAKAAGDRYADARSLAEDIEDVLAERPPRHCGEPTIRTNVAAADAFEGTLAVREASTPPLTDRTWFPGEQTTLRRGATRRVVAGVALLAGVAALHLLRRGGEAPAFAPLPEGAPASRSRTLPLPLLLPEGAEGAPAAQAAFLRLELQHEIKSGQLLVFVDGEQVLDRPLRGRLTKKFLSRRYRGSLREVIEVGPGKRRVRVQVLWDGREKSAAIMGTFQAGSQRRLVATMDGDLSVDWH